MYDKSKTQTEKGVMTMPNLISEESIKSYIKENKVSMDILSGTQIDANDRAEFLDLSYEIRQILGNQKLNKSEKLHYLSKTGHLINLLVEKIEARL